MEPGQTLGHYTIVEQIGVGGMGEVYRARDNTLGREVALKILPAAFGADTERVARFQREAKLLASLNHPNIAAIHSVVQDGDVIGLALELVIGDDLTVHLVNGTVSVNKALDYAEQIAAAVEAAHEQGVVHRDLKPANIKIAQDGTVKVLDFGLAKATDTASESTSSLDTTISPSMASAPLTVEGVILGTVAYMSPEQARGSHLDRRTDIFSFGVVLFEMLVGQRPFGGPTMSDMMASILKEEPDLETLPADTPPAIRLLLNRCLAKDPKQRLRDMGEARLIIAAVRGGDPTASSVLGVRKTETAKQGLAKREIAAWAMTVIAIVALGFSFLRTETTIEQAAKVFRLSLPIEGESDLRYTHGGLAISPDGSRLAYVNQGQLFIRRLDGWDPIAVGETDGASSLFWSPDGAWLAFGLDNELWKVRQDGTQRTLLGVAEIPFSPNSGGAWLVGDRLVYRGERELMVIAATGGVPVVFSGIADTSVIDFHSPATLPGGRGVVTIVHTNTGVNQIGVTGLDGVLKKVMTIEDGKLDNIACSSSGQLLYTDRGSIWGVPFSLSTLTVTGPPFSVARDATLPHVSDDGTLVYVRHAGRIMRRLVLLDRTGAVQERLGRPDDFWPSYTLSPDGTRAAASMDDGNNDLYLHDLREGSTRVTFSDLEHDMPSFSPDGLSVYFSTGTETNYRIGRKVIESSEPEETIIPTGPLQPHYYASCPVVSHDGNILFYSSVSANKKQDVAWLDLAKGGDPQPFLTSDAAEYGARPSPHDIHVVAYVSDEGDQPQIYLTNWPTPGRRWVASVEGGFWPRWNGDGSELYFAKGADIFMVKVDYDPVQVSPPQLLFSRSDFDDRQPYGWPATFDVTADGKRFLDTELVVSEEDNPVIAVIPGWGAAQATQ